MLLQLNFNDAFSFFRLTLPGASLLWKLLSSYRLLLLPCHTPSCLHLPLPPHGPSLLADFSLGKRKKNPKVALLCILPLMMPYLFRDTCTFKRVSLNKTRQTQFRITLSTQMKEGEKAWFPYGSSVDPRCHGREQKSFCHFQKPSVTAGTPPACARHRLLSPLGTRCWSRKAQGNQK